MKLLTFKKNDGYGLGVLVGAHILDLNKALEPKLDMLGLLEKGEEGLKKVKDVVSEAKPEYLMELRQTQLAAPIPRTRKNIVCLGLNYADHVREGVVDRNLPQHPIYFSKPPTSITGPFDPVIYHRSVKKLDYEVELAFVIGKKGREIPIDKVHDYIAGYMVFQDISARGLQRQHNQWFLGKSLDTFAPMGPYLVTKDEIPDSSNLDLWCKVNSKIRQESNTRNLIFDISKIVSTFSAGITLEVGDIFATGTPSGVGYAHELGLLKVGDVIESGIENIGTMKNKVISPK
jgi:2-keto-4-pentenoate hydratase/2-oxohepta-3-ene-1,7-dioic acid hydratase in catechol pathway